MPHFFRILNMHVAGYAFLVVSQSRYSQKTLKCHEFVSLNAGQETQGLETTNEYTCGILNFRCNLPLAITGLFPPCTRMWCGTRTHGGLSIRLDAGKMGEVGRRQKASYYPCDGMPKMYCLHLCVSFRSWDGFFWCSFGGQPEP